MDIEYYLPSCVDPLGLVARSRSLYIVVHSYSLFVYPRLRLHVIHYPLCFVLLCFVLYYIHIGI